jgi:phospholipid/cholesterol/gamma-HCH transport system substrate-binding protein
VKGISTEAKVGLLVLLSMFILAFLTLRVGKYSFNREDGYQLKVKFNSIAGLDLKARVKVSGVDAGYVKEVTLIHGYPELTLWIKEGIEIRENAIAWIRSLGLMGEKYVEIEPGSESLSLLKSGDRITKAIETKDVDEMAEHLGTLAEELIAIAQSLKGVFGTQEGQARLNQIMENMEQMTTGMNSMVMQNQRDINRLVNNLADFSEELNELMFDNKEELAGIISDFSRFSSDLATHGPNMMQDITKTAETLKDLVDPNGYGIGATLKGFADASGRLDFTLQQLSEIAERMNRGEGTIGKLLTEDQVYEDISGTLSDVHSMLSKAESFSLHLGFRSEYLTEFEKSKSYFSLKFQPRKGKYYLLEVIDDFREKVTSTKTIIQDGNVTAIEIEKEEDPLLFNLLMAKQFGPFFLRGGLMESTGGIGIDYYPFGENFFIGIEGWDLGETKPHLKLFASAILKRHFIINIGWDDAINSQTQSFFAGAGFTFEDKDLKYLLSKLPLPGL